MGFRTINTLQEFELALRSRSFVGHTTKAFAGLVYGVMERLCRNGAPFSLIDSILVAAGVKSPGNFRRYFSMGHRLCVDVYAFDRIMDENLMLPVTPPGDFPEEFFRKASGKRSLKKAGKPVEEKPKAARKPLPNPVFGFDDDVISDGDEITVVPPFAPDFGAVRGEDDTFGGGMEKKDDVVFEPKPIQTIKPRRALKMSELFNDSGTMGQGRAFEAAHGEAAPQQPGKNDAGDRRLDPYEEGKRAGIPRDARKR